MSTPYRELYVEPPKPRDTERGRCPWCRANVEFRRAARRAVCADCGARYATSQALRVRDEPVAVAGRATAAQTLNRDYDLSTFGPVAWRVALCVALVVGFVMVAAVSSGGPGAIVWVDLVTIVIALLVNIVRRTMA